MKKKTRRERQQERMKEKCWFNRTGKNDYEQKII